MCKPGSGCCGCAASSSGIGVAAAVVVIAGATSMAATLISGILTAVLVSVLTVAAGGSILLVAILRRTRGVVTWQPGRARPAQPARLARPPARPAISAEPAARPAMTAPRPLAITAADRLRIVARPGSSVLLPDEPPLAGGAGAGDPSTPAGPASRRRVAASSMP